MSLRSLYEDDVTHTPIPDNTEFYEVRITTASGHLRILHTLVLDYALQLLTNGFKEGATEVTMRKSKSYL